jgi:hypothetical protein
MKERTNWSKKDKEKLWRKSKDRCKKDNILLKLENK